MDAKELLIEICCGSAEDAMEAEKGGADRVELNSCLFHGGLTPTVGTLKTVKRHTHIPVMAMARPRQGGFCYTDVEYETLLADAALLLENGADGLVFGFLKEDGSLDQARCKEMLALCGGKPAVFHRAIDVVPDWKRTLGDLIDLGFTRVLTSGQAPNVLYGIDTLRAMMDFAGGAIEILPGGGVNQWTLKRLLAETGATQVHFGHTVNRYDHSTEHNPAIIFGSSLSPEENRYSVTDAAYIQQMRNI